MRYWTVEFTERAKKDREALDSSVRIQVDKAVRKVSANPLAKSEGGYGEPLGNKLGTSLVGLYKIKLRKSGIRVVYKIVLEAGTMKIIVIAARADDEVYDIAFKRTVE